MTPAFAMSQVNPSTYLVVHNDKYFEFPYIYLKLYPDAALAVVIDTGCGSANAKGTRGEKDIKRFIETVIIGKHSTTSGTVAANWRFLVTCTHCHFDHIGGIESFAKSGPSIIASGNDRDFLSRANLPANSFCKAFGLKTPEYHISHFARDGENLCEDGFDLGLHALHTPGHTPDSLAIYDTA